VKTWDFGSLCETRKNGGRVGTLTEKPLEEGYNLKTTGVVQKKIGRRGGKIPGRKLIMGVEFYIRKIKRGGGQKKERQERILRPEKLGKFRFTWSEKVIGKKRRLVSSASRVEKTKKSKTYYSKMGIGEE